VDANEWTAYQQTVQRANDAMKRLELALQGLFDSANSILLRAQALDGLEDSELDALIQDARHAHDALNVLLSVANAQASSQLRTVRDTDSSTLAATADDASVRTGDTVVPHKQSRTSNDVDTPPAEDMSDFSDDDVGVKRRPPKGDKLRRWIGEDLPLEMLPSEEPSYMGPSYGPDDIVLAPDGVRAATLPALIERLTSHELRGTLPRYGLSFAN
jgi:son of sevenless